MFVRREGSGTPIVFVHGGAVDAMAAFRYQLPLAQRWTLLLPDRPGYGKTPPDGAEDFDRDADLIAALVSRQDGGAHLVGHSYGGVITLLCAAQIPSGVRSLTVIEPPAFSLARTPPGGPPARAAYAPCRCQRRPPAAGVVVCRRLSTDSAGTARGVRGAVAI